jgi:hypothetical protein
MSLISILVLVLIVLVVAYGCFWLIDRSLTGSANQLAKIVVGIIALVVLLTRSGLLNGVAL